MQLSLKIITFASNCSGPTIVTGNISGLKLGSMGSMSMRLGTQKMVACPLVQSKDRNVCFFISKVFRAE
jgi:hypothetical protein